VRRPLRHTAGLTAAVLAIAVPVAGCGATHARRSIVAGPTPTIPASILAGERPIGLGTRFTPRTVTGHPTGGCQAKPGTHVAHVELFGANRVILITPGVGHHGRCYGNAVTFDPTGTVYFRPGATLQDLFTAWGQQLSPTRLLSFTGRVRAYLDGKQVPFPPKLTEHAEIVLEVGPYVPPHSHYTFAPPPAGF